MNKKKIQNAHVEEKRGTRSIVELSLVLKEIKRVGGGLFGFFLVRFFLKKA